MFFQIMQKKKINEVLKNKKKDPQGPKIFEALFVQTNTCVTWIPRFNKKKLITGLSFNNFLIF